MRLYASLVGPLLGLYYPLPEEFDEGQARVAFNTSRLKSLWHSVYTEEEVEVQITMYGGMKLPASFANLLDYDSHEVNIVKGIVRRP